MRLINLFLIISLLVGCNIQNNKYYVFNSPSCEGAIYDYHLLLLEQTNSKQYPNWTGIVTDEQEINGEIYKGETKYVNGKIAERRTYYVNNKIRSISPIKCCSNHGTLCYYYQNGKPLYKVEYDLGKMNGVAISYFPNGQIKIAKKFAYDVELTSKEYDSEGKIISVSP